MGADACEQQFPAQGELHGGSQGRQLPARRCHHESWTSDLTALRLSLSDCEVGQCTLLLSPGREGVRKEAAQVLSSPKPSALPWTRTVGPLLPPEQQLLRGQESHVATPLLGSRGKLRPAWRRCGAGVPRGVWPEQGLQAGGALLALPLPAAPGRTYQMADCVCGPTGRGQGWRMATAAVTAQTWAGAITRALFPLYSPSALWEWRSSVLLAPGLEHGPHHRERVNE